MYFCPECQRESKEPATSDYHKLGRVCTCPICGKSQVMVRRVEKVPVEPGQGRPKMSKKERRIFRDFLSKHNDSALIADLAR